jgi:transcriptional regulator with XRE-family HTH domain
MIHDMKSDPRRVFGERVRRVRLERGHSQEALAELCGLHRTYIGAIERGERNVSLLNIVAISRALGIATADLMAGVDK